MSKENVSVLAFNRGLISALGLARVDIKRQAYSAEIQRNFMPRVLGSMMMRPGFGYTYGIYNNAKPVHIPFVFSSSDTALIEMTEEAMRVSVDETVISRVSVSTAISNGTFDTDLTGWTDEDESGATSQWATGGYMSLQGTAYNYAIRKQTVTVAGGDQNKEHALTIVVAQGRLILRVGSSDEADDYISETVLTEGIHSLAFTPTGNFYVYMASQTTYPTLVDSIAVAASGDMVLTTPYQEEDLGFIRYEQSADVTYLSCRGYPPYKIERRGTRSWSLVKYQPEDGPFRTENVSKIRLTPSAISGTITLTSSQNLFEAGHVGALFQITSIGQLIEASFTGEGQFSNPIRITGTGASQRTFTIVRSGTWSGTIHLQRSVGEPGSWVDVTSYTTNGTVNYNDGLNDQIIYYRLGIKTGNYTSGTADTSMTFSSGGLTGKLRITAVASAVSASAIVLSELGGTTASEIWSEGEWSAYRGYPSSVALMEGRLWWFGKGKNWASASDAYEAFDPEIEGDSGPINRSIGSGPVDQINWALPLQRMIVGTDMREISIRSSSFDEPLTPTNFNLKDCSTQGSSAVSPVKIDNKGIFVHKCGTKLYQLDFSDTTYYDYSSFPLNEYVPEVGTSGFVRLGVQRQPDTRVHAIRADGKAGVLIMQPAEEVMCWVEIETDGEIEDVVILPGDVEDRVYYAVKRTIDGNTVRYLEKWAMESECQGTYSDDASLNKQADSFIVYDGSATATITGLDHLEGEEVIVWADGKDYSPLTDPADPDTQTTFTVSSGQITLPATVSKAVIGLPYQAKFKGTKLAYAAQGGTALIQRKRVDHIGFIMANTHNKGLMIGTDFTSGNLRSLPRTERGRPVTTDEVWEHYDNDSFPFNGVMDTDARICLLGMAPRPVTVLAMVMTLKTNDRM